MCTMSSNVTKHCKPLTKRPSIPYNKDMIKPNAFTALDPIDELTPYLFSDEPVEIYSDLDGEDYADAIMADLGMSSDQALFGMYN